MTTEKDKIIEEIKQIEIDCLKSVETHHPEFTNEFAEGREELYNFKLSENWHHYLERKAELKGIQSQKQKIIEVIKKRINDYKKKLRGTQFNGSIQREYKFLRREMEELLNSLGDKKQ